MTELKKLAQQIYADSDKYFSTAQGRKYYRDHMLESYEGDDRHMLKTYLENIGRSKASRGFCGGN